MASREEPFSKLKIKIYDFAFIKINWHFQLYCLKMKLLEVYRLITLNILQTCKKRDKNIMIIK